MSLHFFLLYFGRPRRRLNTFSQVYLPFCPFRFARFAFVLASWLAVDWLALPFPLVRFKYFRFVTSVLSLPFVTSILLDLLLFPGTTEKQPTRQPVNQPTSQSAHHANPKNILVSTPACLNWQPQTSNRLSTSQMSGRRACPENLMRESWFLI